MKNTIYTLLFAITILSCKAQNPIVNIDERYKNTPLGGYFKDLNNEFDTFVGTWEFSSGTTELKIIISKQESFFDGEYYEDILIGEYEYKINGFIIVSTLSNLSDPNVSGREHNISGRTIITGNQFIPCQNCDSNERRMKLYFTDPDRNYLATSIVLRYLEKRN